MRAWQISCVGGTRLIRRSNIRRRIEVMASRSLSRERQGCGGGGNRLPIKSDGLLAVATIRLLGIFRKISNSDLMTPAEKKPYRCKYIFRDRRKMWVTPPAPKQTALVLPDPSNMPKGMSFARLDEIIRQRAKTSLPNVHVDLPDTAAQDSASKTNNPAVSG